MKKYSVWAVNGTKGVTGSYASADAAALDWAKTHLTNVEGVEPGKAQSHFLEVTNLEDGQVYPREIKVRVEFWVTPPTSAND